MLIQRVLVVVGLSLIAGASAMDDAYRQTIERWRVDREAKLKADDGWLTLVGLHWLHEGQSTMGSDPENDVPLPPGAPPKVGVFTLSSGKATLALEPGVAAKVAEKAFTGGQIRSDADGGPDILAIGSIRILFIKRGTRYALRIKDNQSPERKAFAGLDWFPVDMSWKLDARFERYSQPKSVVYETIVGEPQTMEISGDVVFEREGKEYRLQAIAEGEQLWIVFRDGTSGKTTHPNARQLYADAPDKYGRTTLDFNKAMNLPCAFTRYATCPIPPRSNRLTLAITAGEKKYEPAGHSDASAKDTIR